MKSDREVCIMRKRQLLAVTAAALTLGLAGAATAVAVPLAASGQVKAAAAVRHSHPKLILEHRGAGDSAGPSCGFTKAVPFDRFKGLPDFTAKRAARPYIARLHTTQGVITVQALTAQAPCTTFSFRFLAQRGYFTRTHCHRLTTQGIFVLQCGDPTGTGSGGPGYRFNDENLTGATYPAGTVAMANAGPNTNGSQFFFVWKDTTLAPDYTPFGTVIGGMNVLRKIAAAGDDSQNGPGDGYPHRYTAFRHIRIIFGK
jgi:peptidyl-prolyl cis-trans isomerase B (cyclophilin B)